FDDAWSGRLPEGLRPQDDLIVVGTGLTAIDLLLSLRAAGHRGKATALSRHGLLPRPHGPKKAELAPPPPGKSPAELARWLRDESALKGDWRAAVDALRPRAQEIWRGWSRAERA